jgi:hypothetical protein
MSLIPGKCIEYNEERKACVVSERGKSYRLNNESGFKVRTVKIDKCLQQKEGEKRCDYLMDIDHKKLKRAIFIELKGGGLSDALKQLYDTIIYLKDEFKGHQRDARIVGSKDVPGFISLPDYRKLAKEVLPSGGTIVRGTNNIYSENC